MPRFDLEKWFWAHEKYGVTEVAMVPPVSTNPEFEVESVFQALGQITSKHVY